MIELLILEHEIAMIHYLLLCIRRKIKFYCVAKLYRSAAILFCPLEIYITFSSSIQIDLLQIFMIITYKQIGK